MAVEAVGPSSNDGLPNESQLQNSSNKMLVEGGMGGVWEVREGWKGCGGGRDGRDVRGVGVEKREWIRFCWL